MYHPWRIFRSLTSITLRWAELPEGVLGYTDHLVGEVVLSKALTQVERRCTIAHEIQHIVNGPVAPYLMHREELRADREASRLLLPDIKVVGEALAWSPTTSEAADELWVDEDMLRCRLAHLHPSERGYLRRRLAEFEDPRYVL